jgi:hypothetical protein
VKFTVPVGAEAPPPDVVSLTVAVHVVATPAVAGVVQLTDVLELRLFTATELVAELVACTLVVL